MCKKAKFTFPYFVLLLFAFHNVLAFEIKTTIDRNPVSANESFRIIYTATESPDDDPDFSPLEKDFEILNQSQQSNSSWINGQSSKSIKWILNVMPKRTGSLVIPPIDFGDDTSQPATILITKSSVSNHESNDDLFLEVEATPDTPYVQSQILYTLRLFRRVQLTQASLNEPEMIDAIIEKLAEDKNYNTQVNGVEYVVTERKYAIFPQKSGITTIGPIVLTAEVVSNSRPRLNSFFNRQITKTRQVTSKAITLNIQSAPAIFKGKHWIPSEHVKLAEKWSGDVSTMKVGEPLTRTLIIHAKGTTVAQMPELYNGKEIDQLKIYPDQPVLKEKKQADGIIAFREEKIAYIPSKSGRYILPAIEVPWFNTQTKTMEIARIPEKIVRTLTLVQSQTNTQVIDTSDSEKVTEAIAPVVQAVENKLWMWLSIIFACGWLITGFFFIRKEQPKLKEDSMDTSEIKLKETLKALKQACAENNQLAAKDALLAWGKIKYNCNNLSNIASHCEARLRDEIYILNQNLYANKPEQWQGKKLFQFFIENKASEKLSKKTNDGLKPLYEV